VIAPARHDSILTRELIDQLERHQAELEDLEDSVNRTLALLGRSGLLGTPERLITDAAANYLTRVRDRHLAPARVALGSYIASLRSDLRP